MYIEGLRRQQAQRGVGELLFGALGYWLAYHFLPEGEIKGIAILPVVVWYVSMGLMGLDGLSAVGESLHPSPREIKA